MTADEMEQNGSAAESNTGANGEQATARTNTVAIKGRENAASSSDGAVDEASIKVTLKTLAGAAINVEVLKQDTVMDLRNVLMDSHESCYYTHYLLRLDNSDIVNDFAEIGSLLPEETAQSLTLHMSEMCYDERSARAHVQRFRDIIAPPQVTPGSALFGLLPVVSSNNTVHFPALDQDGGADGASQEEVDGLVSEASASLASVASFDFGVDLAVKEAPCIKSLTLSPLNPPPPGRRLHGDLAYFDAVLCDDRHCCITASARGFYVNKTPQGSPVIVPAMDNGAQLSYTLVGLLQLLSPAFKRNFARLLQARAQRDPFESIPNNYTITPWLAPPAGAAAAGAVGARRDDPLLSSVYGMEVGAISRDWNEEHQSCRELPKASVRERSLADRTLFKVSCDFLEAAQQGAVAVVDKCVPPLNPMDPETAHMYVYNSIFFSYAADPREAAAAAAGAAAAGGSTTEAAESLGEQATYASANQDLNGVIRFSRTETVGLYTLATAVVDYRGFRVVAQSIIPGILQGEQLQSLIYGWSDKGSKFVWHEALHEKLKQAAAALHMKEHAIVDGAGASHRVCAPVESKGIMGSDNRMYLMDIVRATPRDPNYHGDQPDAALLRWELVHAHCRLKELEATQHLAPAETTAADSAAEAKPDDAAAGAAPAESKPAEGEAAAAAGAAGEGLLALNVNVCLPAARKPEPAWRLAEGEAEDMAAVQEVADALVGKVIPSLVERCRDLELLPVDGVQLTELLHAEGINLRYMGQVHAAAEAVPYLQDVLAREMVARACKHLFRAALRRTGPSHIAHACAYLLNCLLGRVNGPKDGGAATAAAADARRLRKKKGGRGGWGADGVDPKGPAFDYGSDTLWAAVQEEVSRRFGHPLSGDRAAVLALIHPLPTLRAVAQRAGVQLAPREYDVRAAQPVTPDDVTALVPRAKSSLLQPKEAHELLEMGKAVYQIGHLQKSYEILHRALSAFQVTSGPMNAEVASCYTTLALICAALQDHAAALSHQQRSVCILERVCGWDHHEVAAGYSNLARFAHALGRCRRALYYLRRAESLLLVACGPAHPALAMHHVQTAAVLQDMGQHKAGLRCLHRALVINESKLGAQHVSTAFNYHSTAVALSAMSAYPLAVKNEQRCYEILRKALGDESEQVAESLRWITVFTSRSKLHAQQAKPAGGDGAATAAALAAAAAAVQAAQTNNGGNNGAGKPVMAAGGASKAVLRQGKKGAQASPQVPAV